MSWNAAVAARRTATDDCPPAETGATATRKSAPTRRADARARERCPIVITSHLDRELVDLGRRMTGPLVDAHDGLPARPGGQAEDLPRLGVEPRALEMDAFVALDREVALVRFLELLGRHPDEPVVDVHELRHLVPPASTRARGRRRGGSVTAAAASSVLRGREGTAAPGDIGHSTDASLYGVR